MLAYALTQQRHRIRRDLDLPHDEHDELADRLRDAVDGVLADEYDDDDDDLAVLFWPRAEFDLLLRRWPVLMRSYGSTWDEHRGTVERGPQVGSRSGLSGLAVLSGCVDDLARYSAAVGGDVTDPDVREGMRRIRRSGPGPRVVTSRAGVVLG